MAKAPRRRAARHSRPVSPPAYRVLHQIGDLVQIQLVHDVAAVLLYGLAAETETWAMS